MLPPLTLLFSANSVSIFAAIPLSLLVYLPSPAMQRFDPLLIRMPRFRIDFSPQKFLLALQLPSIFKPRRVKLARSNGPLNRASWLTGVPAVTEMASLRQSLNVAESLRHPFGRIP